MIQVVDIRAELAKLPFLHQRTQDTTRADAMASFISLPYRDGGIFAGSFSGEGQWERHQQGDEIVYILDGAATLTMMTDESPQAFDLTTGMLIVVPQGIWHRFQAPDGVTVMTVSPQPTENFRGDDPRHIEPPASASQRD